MGGVDALDEAEEEPEEKENTGKDTAPGAGEPVEGLGGSGGLGEG